MPLRSMSKNMSFYTYFSVYAGYAVNHPYFTPTPAYVYIPALLIGLMFEIGNYKCHVYLSSLRSDKQCQGYFMPKGFLFDHVTCANYMCEILSWFFASIATGSLAMLLFTICGTIQMTIWARKKHFRLMKIYDGKNGNQKYPERWIIMPFIY